MKPQRAAAKPAVNYQLNVLFHGLWAFETRKEGILAHTPEHDEHVVRAGNFTRYVDLKKGKYELTGVIASDEKHFNISQNVMVEDEKFTGKKMRHCVIHLPFPREIESMRRVTPVTTQPFGGADGGKLHPTKVSMVQVFVFECKSLSKVRVKPLALKPTVSADKQTANLHFFAQPDGPVMPDHYKEAYKMMAQMFGLDIVPAEALYTPAEQSHIKGVSREDLRSLNELDLMSIAARGESGANCDALVVDNLGV